jgi:Cu2+-exporting ATPase
VSEPIPTAPPLNAPSPSAQTAASVGLTDLQQTGLDDPAVLRQCQVGPSELDGAVPVGLGLSGMYCAACAITIEGALKSVPGVRDVQVQGAVQRARLVIDPQKARLSQVVAAVQKAGYQAWPDGAALAQNARVGAQRQLLWRLLVAALCMMQVMMITSAQYVAGPQDIPPDIWRLMNWASWVLSLPVLVFSCGPFFKGAWVALKAGRIAMDTPVALGIAAMFAVSTGVTMGQTEWVGHDAYFDSLTMFVTFLLFGRWLEGRAREQVSQSLEALCGRLPEAVSRSSQAAEVPHEALSESQCEVVPLSQLAVGDRVLVAAGQAFPADGQVVKGQTEVDESLLTGESRPVPRKAGQLVVAGSMNLGAPVWCQVERLGPDTRYQQIVNLVHQALTERPGWLRVADRFAGPFLWAVLALAALGALAWQWVDPSRSVWVAVSVLVVTCPCALSLAAPSALLAAAGALARQGVLVRRLEAVETLASVDLALFDKTGTLTDSQLQLTEVWHEGQVFSLAQGLPEQVQGALQRAASLSLLSQHPASKALAGFAEGAPSAWQGVCEQAGQGLEATDAHGQVWRLGSAQWALGPRAAVQAWANARVWWAPMPSHEQPDGVDHAFGFALDEKIRPDASQALQALSDQGVAVGVLSGDQAERVVALVRQIAVNPPVSVAGAATSPEGKLEVLRKAQESGRIVAAVGDGINDAPVLAKAHASFALDHGAPLAQSQADFIILGGRLQGVPLAAAISRQAMRVVRQNLAWAAIYNFVCIPLALMGLLPPWLAGIGMALSSLLVLLNALRIGGARSANGLSLTPANLTSES